jgi:hypothetical protein
VQLPKLFLQLSIEGTNYLLNTNLKVPIDAFGYYIGYFIGMLVDIIISAIFTGGAKTVADVLKIISKQFTEIYKFAKSTLKYTTKVATNAIEYIIDLLAKLRNSAKNIKPFLDEILEWLRKIFNELKLSKKILNIDEIYKIKYFRPKGLYNKLTFNEVVSKFGKRGGELYEEVEKEWKLLQKTLKTGNDKRRNVLVSGMIDKETGKISKVFTNFTKEEIKVGKHLEFIKGLHPTLKKRLTEHIKRSGKNGSGLNLDDPEVYKFAWKSMDHAHAEFRALDDILKQIDPKGSLGDQAIGRIMGYNSFLFKPGIQHTCADCFYLTYGVNYIK